MDLNTIDISELQALIGLNEDITEKILRRVESIPPSPTLLPIYNLLLLERYEATVPLIRMALEQELDIEYIAYLQKSKYYVQRMSAPCLLRTLSFLGKKSLLRISLQDSVCEVVAEAVKSIIENNPFDTEELVEIALQLFENKYTAVKILSVDVLALIKKNSFFLFDALKSNNWRLRLKVASALDRFDQEDQKKIISELKDDYVEDVRIELSKKKKKRTLDYIDLLKDPCELVRSNYLNNIVELIGDEKIFTELIEDKSWEVKKVLLNLRGDLFKKITIPLIKSSTENISWRIRYDILTLIEQKLDNEFVSKLMMGFLIKNLQDKVCEIRTKSQQILIKVIKKYNWIDEYTYELKAVVTSTNYLHRVSAVPVAIEYDIQMNTHLSESLKNDNVVNVRDFYNDYVRAQSINVGSDEYSLNTDTFEDSQAQMPSGYGYDLK